MLDKIKSSYFSRIIFSFVYEKIKLKLAKYNKSLQNLIDISLINYKLFTGNYIIYEGKRKGKEYDFKGELKYEGEFLNGERNEKGKEYRLGFLEFEGEFLYGERNGKGKEYYYKKGLKYEGEYLNGKRHGKGKEYDNEGKLLFDGDYINNRLEYDGEYFNGRKWNGKGYDENGNIIYELINGTGKGKEYNEYGKLIFEGEYLNG